MNEELVGCSRNQKHFVPAYFDKESDPSSLPAGNFEENRELFRLKVWESV